MSADKTEKFYHYASAQYNACNWEKAADAFWAICAQDSSEKLDPKNWFGLAASLQQLGEYQKAIAAWEMAAKIADALKYINPSIYFHAAECYLSLGNKSKAKQALTEARKRSKRDLELIQKIELLFERNDL